MNKIILIISLLFILKISPLMAEDPPPTTVTPSNGFFTPLTDFVKKVYDAAVCTVKKIMAWFISLVENLFFYLVDIVCQAMVSVIFVVFDLLPSISINFTPLQPYYAAMNYFFPLSETFAIISSVITFKIGFIVIKWILKVSPFIGGG